MAAKYEPRYLEEAEYPAWDRLVDSSPQGSVYSNTGYLRALCAAAGTKFAVLVASRGSEIHGGVALHYRDGRFGRRVEPRGLLYYNGLVLRDFAPKHPGEASARNLEVISTLVHELESERYGSVTLANRHTFPDVRAFLWNGWETMPRYTFVVPIADLDALWGRMDQNARRLVTRCERQGMVFGESDDFQRFYSLTLDTSRRKGLPPHLGRAEYTTLYETLHAAGICRMYTATAADGKVAAAQLVLTSKHPLTHTWAAATDAEHMSSGASPFLRWHAFRALSQEGYTGNDLTDAMHQDVARFKAQLGGDLQPCFVVTRIGSLPLRMQERVKDRILVPMAGIGRRMAGGGGNASPAHAPDVEVA